MGRVLGVPAAIVKKEAYVVGLKNFYQPFVLGAVASQLMRAYSDTIRMRHRVYT